MKDGTGDTEGVWGVWDRSFFSIFTTQRLKNNVMNTCGLFSVKGEKSQGLTTKYSSIEFQNLSSPSIEKHNSIITFLAVQGIV